MRYVKIYTAGKMGGLAFAEKMGWRSAFEKELGTRISDWVKIDYIHPPMFYDYDDPSPNFKHVEEIKTWDLTQLSTCDIVVVNLKDIETSIGTCMELGFIDALNATRSKKIFVIGIGDENKLNQWIKQSMFRVEESIASAADYIRKYLLV